MDKKKAIKKDRKKLICSELAAAIRKVDHTATSL